MLSLRDTLGEITMTNETATEPEAPTRKRPLYRRGWFVAVLVIVAVPVVAVGWWLGSPLFLNKTVIEAFPTTSTVATPAEGPAETPAEGPAATPAEGPAETPAVSQAEEPPTEVSAATEAPGEPVALFTGAFEGADASHQGSGAVAIYQLDDGSRVLRFENLDVTNGPDLRVIISPVADPQSSDDVSATGSINLGKLKGNRGDQNYEIPADFDLSQAGSIVIYCQPFSVIFATATLSHAKCIN